MPPEMTLDRAASVSPRTSSSQRATPARAEAVNYVRREIQMNRSSDKCQQILVVDVSPET